VDVRAARVRVAQIDEPLVFTSLDMTAPRAIAGLARLVRRRCSVRVSGGRAHERD